MNFTTNGDLHRAWYSLHEKSVRTFLATAVMDTMKVGMDAFHDVCACLLAREHLEREASRHVDKDNSMADVWNLCGGAAHAVVHSSYRDLLRDTEEVEITNNLTREEVDLEMFEVGTTLHEMDLIDSTDLSKPCIEPIAHVMARSAMGIAIRDLWGNFSDKVGKILNSREGTGVIECLLPPLTFSTNSTDDPWIELRKKERERIVAILGAMMPDICLEEAHRNIICNMSLDEVVIHALAMYENRVLQEILMIQETKKAA